MRPKLPAAKRLRVLEEAIEAGVAYGWRRAFKYTDMSDPELSTRILDADPVFLEAIEQAVFTEICEAFDFEEAS